MLSNLVSEELIITDLRCKTSEEALFKLTKPLIQHGYVEPEYFKEVIKREIKFPTGLPTKPFPVALAHSNSIHVINSGIAIGILRNAVPFKEMGSPEKTLNVKIIFLLAIKEAEQQTNILKGLVNFLSKHDQIQGLINAKNRKDVTKILQNGEGE